MTNQTNLIQLRPSIWDAIGNFSPPKRLTKLLDDLLNLLWCAEDYDKFAPKGGADKGTSRDGAHRIRLLHDELWLDYKKNRCLGVMYRSQQVLGVSVPATGKHAQYLQTHGEHVLPINIVARLIWNRNCEAKFNRETLLQFILERTCVCQITSEEESHLRARRTIGGENSSWVRKHPCVKADAAGQFGFVNLKGEKIDELEILVFARYLHSNVKVVLIDNFDAKDVDIKAYTLRDHISATRAFYGIPKA